MINLFTDRVAKLVCAVLVLGMLFLASCKKENQSFSGFQVPSHFPEPTYPMETNPITEAGFQLGRKLFYDGRLSRDGSVSCGSCHIQYSAFTQHGHVLSHGIDDQLGTRNSASLQNLAWGTSFFWDGGVHNLDLVPFNPIENPVEMDETVANVLVKLRNDAEYPELFKAAFGSDEINTARTMQAMSQFMLMLVSANSRYDQYIQGNSSALSADEVEGLQLFRQKCAGCHVEPLFTDDSYRNNGLDTTNDLGRYQVSALEQDRYKFKVPTLRNVVYTKPYMHSGKVSSLQQVLNHYQSGIVHSSTLDPQLENGIPMTDDEKAKIILFLESLSDESFIKNPLFSEI